MSSRRGTSSGGGASSLGYLFGSDATQLARPNNRAPPRPQPVEDSNIDVALIGYNSLSRRGGGGQQFEDLVPIGYETSTGFETPTGYQTPTLGYHTPLDYQAASDNYRSSNMGHQTRAAGKVINDGGGMSLDMSGGSMGHNNNYFRADGQNSGNFITARPSTRVQAAPGGGSSLGYLFGGT